MMPGTWVMSCVLTGILFAVPVSAAEITVSAASSLRDAFLEIKELFEQAHPGLTVHVNCAASNLLLRQMEHGAPVDVFASADRETMDRAAAGGLVDPASRRDFARTVPVLVVPAGTAEGRDFGRGLAVLQEAGFERLAVGAPASVPAGRYARDALKAAGLWEALQPRLVYGQNVRQVLEYVVRGEADAGFVYRTDALKAENRVVVAAEIQDRPVFYPVAVSLTGTNPAGGAAFAEFVTGPAGRAALERHGFAAP